MDTLKALIGSNRKHLQQFESLRITLTQTKTNRQISGNRSSGCAYWKDSLRGFVSNLWRNFERSTANPVSDRLHIPLEYRLRKIAVLTKRNEKNAKRQRIILWHYIAGSEDEKKRTPQGERNDVVDARPQQRFLTRNVIGQRKACPMKRFLMINMPRLAPT